MAKKQNPILAAQERMLEARYRARLHESLRIGEDALLISAEDVLGITEEQADELLRVYQDTVREIARMVVSDSADDPEMEWSRSKVDERIRGIVGEKKFRRWEERHS